MAKFKIYLDTSVINFLHADDAPEKKEITVDFFENIIKLSIYDTFVSEYVLAEIKRTPNVIRRNQLMKVFEDYPIAVLPNPSVTEVEVLSVAYLD